MGRLPVTVHLDSLDELVTMRALEAHVGRTFTGTCTLALYDSPVEELTALQPQEMIAGYWREVAMSWQSGTTLRRRNLPEVGSDDGE